MLFSLVTPNKKVFTDIEVDEVIIPGEMGELDVLPGHAPLVTTLSAGCLKWLPKGEKTFKTAIICWGYAEVSPEGVNVMSDTAELPEEIDLNRAKEAFELSEKRLIEAGLGPAEYTKLQKKVAQAKARLESKR